MEKTKKYLHDMYYLYKPIEYVCQNDPYVNT